MFRLLLLLPLAAILDLKPVRQTAAVSDDPDDPAIWVNVQNPARSLILGTNKVKAPNGAVYVFGLDGQVKQRISGVDRPNNIDVEYGLAGLDIAVATERLTNRLRVFAVNASGLRDAGAIDCCPEPMGIGLYKRPRDGAIFAIVSPKGRATSPRRDYLYQYRLQREGDRVTGKLVRRFGNFSGTKEIEAVVVDDAMGVVYYSDEGAGIRKYHADPDHPQAARELSLFAKSGFRGDREGLAIYSRPNGTGFLISTDQLPGNSEYHVFDRQGGNPELFVFRGGADTTDGIEVTSTPLGQEFPSGLFIAMNSGPRNFLLYDPRTVFGKRLQE
ncbi:MAG: phytase [Bryobacteraceae bacterium]|nr:phytase [Bryobacteraceae bacterium]